MKLQHQDLKAVKVVDSVADTAVELGGRAETDDYRSFRRLQCPNDVEQG